MEFANYFKELFTIYETTKLVRIKSPVVAVTSCVLVLLVLFSYLASIQLDIGRVYTSPCSVRGVVLSKVKGFASTQHLTAEDLAIEFPELYSRTWDATDVVFPVYGGEGHSGSFSIATNLVITQNQTKSTCPEYASPTTNCKQDKDCQEGAWSTNGFWSGTNGVFTGKCVNTTKTCEINGWCPVEPDKLPRKGQRPLLEAVANFTVMLKNIVEFPQCGDEYRSTNLHNSTLAYLNNCTYTNTTHRFCPKFTIGEIVAKSGADFNKVAIKGGVFRIRIKWKCDFTLGRTIDDCGIKYKFRRVDSDNNTASEGWSFRSAHYHTLNNRTLIKRYGLKILIDVEGGGRTFDFFQLITTLGSTVGLFCLAPLICDFLLDILNMIFVKWKWSNKYHEYCDRYGDSEHATDDFQVLKLKLLMLLAVAIFFLLWIAGSG